MYTEEIELYFDAYKEGLDKAIDHLADEYLQIRAGRANPKIVERVMVDYYGTMTPLNQMSTISVPEPRMVTVSLWDISQLRNVTKAIMEANLGVTPSDDGRVIRLVFPMLTEERRREIAKEVGRLAESTKITCRNERRDILDELKKLKKDAQVSEDEFANLEKEVQKLVDEKIALIDKMQQEKEKDIMSL